MTYEHEDILKAEREAARWGTPDPTRGQRNQPAATDDNYDLDKGGVKYDEGKPRYDLLPPEFLEGTAHVMTYGAAKYRARNWEAGMRWGRPFGALMRHLWAWWRGEKCDPETGFSHLWHAACMLAFLIAYEQRDIGEDDRFFKEEK